MMYLSLSILISSSLYVIFKLFQRFEIRNFQAIVVNYLAACLTGLILYPPSASIGEIIQQPWVYGSIFMGLLFISVFMIMALTSQRNGLSAASIASKMSVVLPILAGVLLYHEALGPVRILGILLALCAVYLAASRQEKVHLTASTLLFPALLFLGSGTIDVLLKYLETRMVPDHEIPLFSSAIFGFAAVAGLLAMAIKPLGLREGIRRKDWIGGIALGIPNYFSIYFLLKALKGSDLSSATLFTINNVGIVLLTSFFGLLLFREKLYPRNWAGVALAIFSILLISEIITFG